MRQKLPDGGAAEHGRCSSVTGPPTRQQRVNVVEVPGCFAEADASVALRRRDVAAKCSQLTATSNNPFVPLYYYVSRKTRDGRVLGSHEKISREEALRIATYNNAFATWEEKVKGSIEPGKLADFLVLSGDFMTIPEDDILKLHPMATYVGGRKVYAAPEANGAF